MLLVLNILLLAAAVPILILLAVFVLECLAALLPGAGRHEPPQGQRPSVAVLIPAHNEQAGIAATVAQVKPQLRDNDRLIVVADNCTDDTAALALQAGATVLQRTDAQRRGKGYALDFGIQHLAQDPPQVLFIMDADCRLLDNTLHAAAGAVQATARPVQVSNLLEPAGQLRARDLTSALAFLVKNLVRPLGLRRLGAPCLLMGTGMALPWSIASRLPLAKADIVEDMRLGLDLAIAGQPPLLCTAGGVRSPLAKGTSALTQRRRWEHGHLQTLLTQVPRLTFHALRQRRLDLLALALDLAIPPLSLLVMLWAALWSLAAALALAGGATGALWALSGAGAGLLLGVLGAWFGFARHLIPLRALLAVPFYTLWKLPLYLGFLRRREQNWIRTDRAAQ